jgi:hypothetical protein
MLEKVDKFKYEGQWDDDKMGDGPGELIVVDSLSYKGNFKNNQFDQYGTLNVLGEYTYEGHFENSKKHGSGRIKGVYEGMWN